MEFQIFGFTIGKTKQEEKLEKNIKSFVPPTETESAISLLEPGAFGTPTGVTIDTNGSHLSENNLITKYREIAMIPEVDFAVDEIASEAICYDEDREMITLNLDKTGLSNSSKKKIQESFKHVLNLLNFKQKGHDIFKRWYIDGRLNYHIIIDNNNPLSGILELRYIDPRRIKKVRVYKNKQENKYYDLQSYPTNIDVDEYYIYNHQGVDTNASPLTETAGVKITTDSIAHANCGIFDPNSKIVLSYLHKALRISNNLRMLEDSAVIYRLSRAPERRIFYIDVGNLPKQKAEQHMNQIMTKYKSKIVYDVQTGAIRDDRRHLAMTEDYWIPRREGKSTTEIDTLPGGENLGEIADLEYFKNNLYESLNIPKSRFSSESPMFGKGTEITREEVKFSKFVERIKLKFCDLFDDLLCKQLVLTKQITKDEWNEIRQDIYYDFIKDSYFQEAFELDVLQSRINIVTQLEPMMDIYFSKRYVQKKILRMTDEEIEEIDDNIEEEPYFDPDNFQGFNDDGSGQDVGLKGKARTLQNLKNG